METGYLQIGAFADNIAQPIDNAEISINIDGEKSTVYTDSSGQYTILEIPCPDRKYSLEPQFEVRPYAVCDITVKKQGMNTTIVKGVEVLAGSTAIQDVFLDSLPEKDAPDEIIVIPDHVLWGDYPPKIVVDPDSQIPVSPGDVLPFPLVPDTVMVHDGLPTNSAAANYEVMFIDYIKNVASSEIYSTWPEQTLRANIFAILSFTLNRVYSEWYRAHGYSFTITSSTQFDQKYIHGRNIFLEISRVVDDIFEHYIQRGDREYPFFAQYNDGIKTNNNGWLSQWGSKDLGDRGYTDIGILQYYYGTDISLQTAAVIEGMPFSFPGYNMTAGICGEAVQNLQAELNLITSSFPAIPKIYPVDGVYGPGTVRAVETFQRVFGIPATGITNFPTWYRISLVYTAVSKMLQGRYTS